MMLNVQMRKPVPVSCPGRMKKKTSYFVTILPRVGDRTHDLPHTVASKMAILIVNGPSDMYYTL